MYVPIIKWKMGEYQALLRLDNQIKKNVCPLIEIPPIGWDFEQQRLMRTIDEHLSGFGKKLNIKWGKASAFLDLALLDNQARMGNGNHPVEDIFTDIRAYTKAIIPVTSFDRDRAYQKAVKAVTQIDRNGICLRLVMQDLSAGNIDLKLKALADYFEIDLSQIDIIVDLKSPNFTPVDIFANALRNAMSKIKAFRTCRSFTIAATAFPESMGSQTEGVNTVSRDEWLLFTKYISLLSKTERQPQFGDYTIAHPEVLNMDMRFVKPAASLRYTIDNSWVIIKGKNVRDYKFSQYVKICETFVQSNDFNGPSYSEGDQYIYNCSKGINSTGTLTTWRWVGVNHHITKVVNDLANLNALSRSSLQGTEARPR